MAERKPLKREYGKYIEIPKEIDKLAKESARKIAEMCSDIDLVDIEYLFTNCFSFEMCMIGMEENCEMVRKEWEKSHNKEEIK